MSATTHVTLDFAVVEQRQASVPGSRPSPARKTRVTIAVLAAIVVLSGGLSAALADERGACNAEAHQQCIDRGGEWDSYNCECTGGGEPASPVTRSSPDSIFVEPVPSTGPSIYVPIGEDPEDPGDAPPDDPAASAPDDLGGIGLDVHPKESPKKLDNSIRDIILNMTHK